jgi:hypothetical protein
MLGVCADQSTILIALLNAVFAVAGLRSAVWDFAAEFCFETAISAELHLRRPASLTPLAMAVRTLPASLLDQSSARYRQRNVDAAKRSSKSG